MIPEYTIVKRPPRDGLYELRLDGHPPVGYATLQGAMAQGVVSGAPGVIVYLGGSEPVEMVRYT